MLLKLRQIYVCEAGWIRTLTYALSSPSRTCTGVGFVVVDSRITFSRRSVARCRDSSQAAVLRTFATCALYRKTPNAASAISMSGSQTVIWSLEDIAGCRLEESIKAHSGRRWYLPRY